MNNKFNISLAILQIIAGILGAMVFFKSFLNYGEVTITMTILSFFCGSMSNNVGDNLNQ